MKQLRTLRRGLGILLALTMGLCLLTTTALAETGQMADFTVNADTALALLRNGDEDSALWDTETKVLTLKGVSFTTSAAIAVKLPAGSSILLEEGTSNIITSSNRDITEQYSYGIFVESGTLTIEDNGTLTVTSGAAQYTSTGIYVKGNLTIIGGTVNAYGSGDAGSSNGISADQIVEITGGTVTAKGDAAINSYGIDAWGVEISGGTVTAIGADGGSSINRSVGIWTQDHVTISGDADVTITGGTAITESYGIWTQVGDVTITGGTVTVTGSDAEDSYGILPGTHGGNTITISGGHVIARTLATTATNKSALQVDGALDLSAYANYQWRTSSSGAYTSSTTTEYTYSDAHTYVEFDKASSIDETADFTGDPFKALTLLTNGDLSKASWNIATKTLTLKGVSFTTSATTAVVLPGDSTIVLEQGTENTITSTSPSTSLDPSYGIFGSGKLTIGGSGTLTVTSGATESTSRGIYVYDFTITGGTVFANGGANSNSSIGIFSDGVAEIQGGEVTAMGGNADKSSSGISAYKVIISGGTVTATGNTTNERSIGIRANIDVTISGDDTVVTATGGNAVNGSHGIFSDFGDVTISGGTVEATSNSTADGRFGICTMEGKIAISGGHVIAKGTSALSRNPDLSSYANYQWRTNSGGAYTSSTATPYSYKATHTYVEFSKGAIATTYAITATDGKATAAGAEISAAAEGTTVTLTANPAPAGKVFDKWVVISGSITLADASSATTTFTMPASAVSVKATYKTILTTLSVTVDTPVVGAMPDLTATVNGVGYSAKNLSWFVNDGGTWKNASYQPFVAGMEYDIVLEFYADDGYAFASEEALTVTINGKEATYNQRAGDYAVRYQLWGIYPSSGEDLPLTGDDSSLLLWIVLMLTSGLGVTGIVVYGRRNKYAK